MFFLFSFPGSSDVRVCFGAWVPDNYLLTMGNVLITFNWFCLQSLSPLSLLQFASVSVKSS